MISLKDVTKVYRRSHLGQVSESTGVRGLDLEVRRGETFGLLGLNGCGKTTTIKLILGLHRPTSGSVAVMGKSMPDLDVLARVGYAPESASLNPALTGRETVELFAALAGVPADERARRVQETLTVVGLDAAADRRLSEYSKGMAQRASLAQALVHDPELLILDEPITGLDPLAILEMRELLLWLKGLGKTLLLASHDVSEVERVCDRLAIMSAGRVAAVLEQSQWRGDPDLIMRTFSANARRTESVGPIAIPHGR